MRHALVTGASGFIGRRLCARLRTDGVEVTALHRRPAAGPWQHERLWDLAEGPPPSSVLQGVDTVFHLAGYAHALDDPRADERHQAVSVAGTRHLLAACPDSVACLVFASSVKAMGESTPNGCLDEAAPARPTTGYGRARLAAEALVLGAARPSRRTVLRLPLVYGPGVRGNLERMLRGARSGRMPLLPDFGNRRTLAGVEHVVDAALAAARTPQAHGRVYLIGDGIDYGTREIQLLMLEAAGRRRPRLALPRWSLNVAAAVGDLLRAAGVRRVPFDSVALAKLAADACYQITRARRELGFSPRGGLREALPEMLAMLDEGASAS